MKKKPKLPKKQAKHKPPELKWKDEYYIEIYKYLSQGFTVEETAALIGVSHSGLKLWIKKKPVLAEKLKELALAKEDKEVDTFIDFVYDTLPDDLKVIWDQIETFQKEPSAQKKIESLFENDQGKRARQYLFFYALIGSNFNASMAMKKVRISKSTLDNWCEEPAFIQIWEQMSYHEKQLAQGCLYKLMRQGNPAVTIFVNRSINSDKFNPAKRIEDSKSSTVVTINVKEMTLEEKIKKLEEARAEKARQSLTNGQTIIVPTESSIIEPTEETS